MDDCDGLENRSGQQLTEGSNPSPSALDLQLIDPSLAAMLALWGGARVVDWGRLLSG